MLLTGVLSTASATTALAASPAAIHPAKAAAVPWAKAGPGWSVVQYTTATRGSASKPAQSGRDTLYLTSPQGRKYAFYSWKPAAAVPILVDWSGDRQRVLLASKTDYATPAHVEQVSLVTGKVISKFTLPSELTPIEYTKPDGLNLLAISDDGKLVRYDLQGHRQIVLGSASKGAFNALYSPDGTSVITTAAKGLEQVSNTGGIIKRLPAARPVMFCFPNRWWSAGTVLAGCNASKFSRLRLWLFNVGTGRSRLLASASFPTTAADGAWQLSGRLYVQAEVSCPLIDQVLPNNSVHPVKVPGIRSASMVDSFGERLLVTGSPQCLSASNSLFWFNPSTHAVSYVFRPRGASFGVVRVAPFGLQATF
jgi:TolB protein